MTHQEKIEYIRQKAIEVNPAIKDLVFGCKVRIETPKRYREFTYGKYKYTVATILFHMEINDMEDNDTRTIAWLDDWNEECDLSSHDESEIEILGREIRLADVLLAVEKIGREKGHSYLGHISDDMGVVISKWNLTQDSLSLQPPECVEFIYQLLK